MSTDDLLAIVEAKRQEQAKRTAAEKESLGFYLTSHPLSQHSHRIERYAQTQNRDLAEMDDQAPVTLAGMVGSIKIATAKKSNAGLSCNATRSAGTW